MKIIPIVFIISFAHFSNSSDRVMQIRKFIESELSHYPEAHLKDLYKNYFQDAFGPGHLITDTLQAGSYLDWELQQTDWADTLAYQALGTNHVFYRINLELVKKGVIPRDTLLNGMVRSAGMARKPSVEEWTKEWNEVLKIIKVMRPDLPDLSAEEQLIAETLAKGEVVMHHSAQYEKSYHPHYRIIHRSIFERWEKSYLKHK